MLQDLTGGSTNCAIRMNGSRAVESGPRHYYQVFCPNLPGKRMHVDPRDLSICKASPSPLPCVVRVEADFS
ncbi:hypothetical protein PAXINDRAFT_21775 [Paxillus involutus ATCC 200175]|uniref:Uncharacterized protein n=1 Tax=Paxillus involutus ATCC 200175 TaxID=664439 RepID=A0A0C9T0F2_PAXIN|nr:hypothetical protein PAXINDRAFT_21775 [Paxillus involutus ATCC 200175]